MKLLIRFFYFLTAYCFVAINGVAQTDTVLTKNQGGIRFKPENISLNVGLLVAQQKSEYYSHRFNPAIGRSSFEGYVLQPVSFGYDLSLTYFLVRKKGFLLDIGLGVWAYSLNYKAVEDSIILIKPNSDIRQYFRTYTVFSLPVSFNYQLKKGLLIGVKTSLPVVSESKITSPDSTHGYKGNLNVFDWAHLFVEGRIGYEFRIKGVLLTPTIAFGGIPIPTQRARYFYKVGLSIRYVRNEK